MRVEASPFLSNENAFHQTLAPKGRPNLAQRLALGKVEEVMEVPEGRLSSRARSLAPAERFLLPERH